MKKGFTLIELLIVVAIIAILAAIAVPNFLEAQVRSKISRAKADLRTYGVAINAYSVDHNGKNPPGYSTEGVYGGQNNNRHWCYKYMTTPIAYITSLPQDPFNPDTSGPGNRPETKWYYYNDLLDPVWKKTPTANSSLAQTLPFVIKSGYSWGMYSTGPERKEISTPSMELIIAHKNGFQNGITAADMASIYDPTNGTISRGRIFYTSKGIWEHGVK